ncbi:hypothetical protein SAMN05216241_10263 [Limimonas halophila]|uniref:Uncharacterized protein n=2 Tax=Limimonas halophila TaxID=1082479 RepID=A0A1G7N8K3_9PROT|nr:hypothetical protein SAMN05216241_10263 [Limimonas halophila]
MRYEAALLAVGLVVAPALTDAGERTVTVTKETCAQLVKHDPAADVAYEGGVDVHGNEVTPAELGGGHDLKLPKTITIPIEVELFETGTPSGEGEGSADGPAVPVEGAGFTADAEVGTVAVDLETGRASFNGRPITSRAQHELAERCQERFGTGTP